MSTFKSPLHQKAASWIKNADALVITAGAGMGVDSGLADYRGNSGQWGQVESDSDKSVFEVVNPKALLDNPEYGWSLFAKRMHEYKTTPPHDGFYILKNWIEQFSLDYFVITSNIDSHFQKAGFEESHIRELHGSLAYFQSSQPNQDNSIWKNKLTAEQINRGISNGSYPTCPNSSVPARPNVYMFRDDTFVNTRTKMQETYFEQFLSRNKNRKIIVFEIGSGPHVQAVRMKTRFLKSNYDAFVVRINPKDFKIKAPHIGIAEGALEALTKINRFL